MKVDGDVILSVEEGQTVTVNGLTLRFGKVESAQPWERAFRSVALKLGLVSQEEQDKVPFEELNVLMHRFAFCSADERKQLEDENLRLKSLRSLICDAFTYDTGVSDELLLDAARMAQQTCLEEPAMRRQHDRFQTFRKKVARLLNRFSGPGSSDRDILKELARLLSTIPGGAPGKKPQRVASKKTAKKVLDKKRK